MASNSGWSKNVPSGSSSIAQGDDDIRSFKSFMQAAWEQEHYFTDGSTLSAGVAKHGAGRAFVGTASQLSNPTKDNDGRLFWVTDTKELRIGQFSSSSWSVASDNIQLSSANSWTALQGYSSGITSSDIAIGGAFSGIVSGSTAIASTTAIDVAGSTGAEFAMVNTGSALTIGDPIAICVTTKNDDCVASASVRSSTGSIIVTMVNRNTVSVDSLLAGTVVRYVGFKA